MLTGAEFAIFAFDPVPEAVRALAIDEDEQVFVVVLGDFAMEGEPGFGVGDVAIVGMYFEDDRAAEFGDGVGLAFGVLGVEAQRVAARRAGPAEFLDEEGAEVEVLQALPNLCNVDRHGLSSSLVARQAQRANDLRFGRVVLVADPTEAGILPQ